MKPLRRSSNETTAPITVTITDIRRDNRGRNRGRCGNNYSWLITAHDVAAAYRNWSRPTAQEAEEEVYEFLVVGVDLDLHVGQQVRIKRNPRGLFSLGKEDAMAFRTLASQMRAAVVEANRS